MMYFKSAEPFGKHSLVPFTAPISIGKIYYDGDLVFGSLWCNDRCIFSTKRHDPSHDCGGMYDYLGNIITRINIDVDDNLSRGRPDVIINCTTWK